jgi:hypothetical protein
MSFVSCTTDRLRSCRSPVRRLKSPLTLFNMRRVAVDPFGWRLKSMCPFLFALLASVPEKQPLNAESFCSLICQAESLREITKLGGEDVCHLLLYSRARRYTCDPREDIFRSSRGILIRVRVDQNGAAHSLIPQLVNFKIFATWRWEFISALDGILEYPYFSQSGQLAEYQNLDTLEAHWVLYYASIVQTVSKRLLVRSPTMPP